MTILIQKNYNHILVDDLILKQNFKNVMEIPKINKIVLNISSKDGVDLLVSFFVLELISGQKIDITKAKKSLAIFKLRKNQTIGSKVILRKLKKLAFFEKLIHILLPRTTNYNGIPLSSLDKKGNLNIGLNNIFMVPEIEPYFQYFEKVTGFNISIETSTKTKNEGLVFFSAFQIPFKI